MTASAQDVRTERVLIVASALREHLMFSEEDDVRDLFEWLESERVYAAGRGDHLRAAVLEEVTRVMRDWGLADPDTTDEVLAAAAAVIDALDGDDQEDG
jgi:hypothetical protein